MRVAFTSCICTHAQPHQPVWTQIVAAQPDYLLLLGDLMYLDSHTSTHPKQMDVTEFTQLAHSRYVQLMEQPQFRALVRHLGPGRVFATWDDHDFLWDNAYGANERADPSQSDKVLRSTALHQAFRRTLAIGLKAGSFPSRYDDPELWRPDQGLLEVPSIPLGGQHVLHLCDVRTYRTRKEMLAPARRHLLGDRQRNKISAAVAQYGPNTIHLLASATTLDEWDEYPADLAWLRTLGAVRRILVLSGDVHENRVQHVGTAGFPVHELTSSGAAVRSLVTLGRQQQNFGMLDIGPVASTAELYHFGRTQAELTRILDHPSWSTGDKPNGTN